MLGNHPDDAIIHEVQPLVHAQATYIDQLEFELGQKSGALGNLEELIQQLQEKHEGDMSEMGAKFKRIDEAYRLDAVESKQ